SLVRVIVNGHAGAALGEPQRDPASDPARASGYQRVLALQRHGLLLLDGRRDHARDVVRAPDRILSPRPDSLDHAPEPTVVGQREPHDEGEEVIASSHRSLLVVVPYGAFKIR